MLSDIFISFLSIDGDLNIFINLPELLGDQPLFEQQATLLFAAYHSVDIYYYIKKYGTSELGQFISLSEKKARLFEGRFVHLTGVDNFEDSIFTCYAGLYLASRVTDDYFKFQ